MIRNANVPRTIKHHGEDSDVEEGESEKGSEVSTDPFLPEEEVKPKQITS